VWAIFINRAVHTCGVADLPPFAFQRAALPLALLALFLLLYEHERFVSAALVFALALTIKETGPVFMAGLGIIFIILGRRRHGLFMFLGASGYSLNVVLFLLMPALREGASYHYCGSISKSRRYHGGHSAVSGHASGGLLGSPLAAAQSITSRCSFCCRF